MRLQDLDINTDYPCNSANYRKAADAQSDGSFIHYTEETAADLPTPGSS
jgi:hypothetical protein